MLARLRPFHMIWLGITSDSLGAWLGTQGPNAWRYLYLIGVLPALVVLWIRRNIPESPRWEEANERRRFAHTQRQSGADPLHRDRSVLRSLGAPAADLRLPDDAVSDLRVLGGRHLYPDLCRWGRRQSRAIGSGMGRLGRTHHQRVRHTRVRQLGLSGRRNRP